MLELPTQNLGKNGQPEIEGNELHAKVIYMMESSDQ